MMRVRNVTTGLQIKQSQALRRIEQCISEWVREGFSIRDLSLPEIVARRSEVAKLQEPLARVENPGLRYEPATQSIASTRESRVIATASNFLFGAKIHMLNNPDALEILDQAANRFCIEHA